MATLYCSSCPRATTHVCTSSSCGDAGHWCDRCYARTHPTPGCCQQHAASLDPGPEITAASLMAAIGLCGWTTIDGVRKDAPKYMSANIAAPVRAVLLGLPLHKPLRDTFPTATQGQLQAWEAFVVARARQMGGWDSTIQVIQELYAPPSDTPTEQKAHADFDLSQWPHHQMANTITCRANWAAPLVYSAHGATTDATVYTDVTGGTPMKTGETAHFFGTERHAGANPVDRTLPAHATFVSRRVAWAPYPPQGTETQWVFATPTEGGGRTLEANRVAFPSVAGPAFDEALTLSKDQLAYGAAYYRLITFGTPAPA